MFDTAEEYAGGKSEKEMCGVLILLFYTLDLLPMLISLGDLQSEILDYGVQI